MSLRVFVLTSDKYSWALAPFSYLFNLYWSSLQPVVVAGYTPPVFGLPENFTFFSLGGVDGGPGLWSNGLIKLIASQPDEYFVLLLEDYWLCRGVDHAGILTLQAYMTDHPEVVRFDLTADRLYGYMMRDVEPFGHYDIIECSEDAPYQMSLQAAIWRKDLLLQLLQRNKSAWEVEIHTNMQGRGMRVLGSRQWPVRYANAVYKGLLDPHEVERIPEPHRSVIADWIPSHLSKREVW